MNMLTLAFDSRKNMTTRLEKQIDFLRTMDRLKDVLRSNKTLNGRRNENSAEHSWSVGMMAHLLSDKLRLPH